jgi:GNAT superfamily N-acetyltransferase
VGTEHPAEEVAAALPADAREPGFRLVVAREDGGPLIGFAYGYLDFLEPPAGGWSSRLASALGGERYGWLNGQFGFAWFGVRPSFQGRGIGSALHDLLLADLPSDRAWLVCPAHETEVRAFYERRGWEVLALDASAREPSGRSWGWT